MLKTLQVLSSVIYTAPGLVSQALLKTASGHCKHDLKRKDCEFFVK